MTFQLMSLIYGRFSVLLLTTLLLRSFNDPYAYVVYVMTRSVIYLSTSLNGLLMNTFNDPYTYVVYVMTLRVIYLSTSLNG